MSRQSDNKVTMQIRVDVGVHKILKIEAARRSETIRELAERYIIDGFDNENVKFE